MSQTYRLTRQPTITSTRLSSVCCPRVYECMACGDQFSHENVLNARCGHSYCGGCLEYLLRESMKDETLFPPRCDQIPFSFKAASRHLSPELVEELLAKREELEDQNKLYCSNHICSAYVPTGAREDRTAVCQKCTAVTCIKCKGKYHVGDCPRDEATHAVLSLAQREGWQRCQECKNMVELNTGCNHMTCRCSHEFCYVCGVKWHECSCPLFDEDRLPERAQVVVDRDGEDGEVGDVAAVAENLRDQHECDHQRMRWVPGSFNCEGCGHAMKNFIFRCGNC